ncbi:MAG: transposase [Nitrososphaeraceae archaeon]|nr:transposase [Nitrososphaeraceae archaeon]
MVPLSADFTQANVYDNNQIYPAITSSLPHQGVRYVAADSGYDDHKLYNLSIDRGFELVCPVLQQDHTPSDRLQLINFYDSELGQAIYSWRGICVEPLIEHIKDVFKIDPLQVRGYQKAAGTTLLSVLLYQIIIVYYNCKTHKQYPKAIKHMLGSYVVKSM